MRADVVINVSAVSMLGVVADLLTDVEFISVVFAVINLEFCFKVVYIVEELTVASPGAMTGKTPGVNANTGVFSALEFVVAAPSEQSFRCL